MIDELISYTKEQSDQGEIDVFTIEAADRGENIESNKVLKQIPRVKQRRGNSVSRIVSSYYYVRKDVLIPDLVAELTGLEDLFSVGVLDENNEAIGVIIRRQLFDLLGYGRNFIEDRKAVDVMQYVKSFSPEANIFSVSEAITEEMKSSLIKYFLLRDRNRGFCGIFSTKDMLIYLSMVVNKDVALARILQSRIVRDFESHQAGGSEILGCSRMAKDVGGDFYNIKEFKPGHWFLAIADVSGKGFSASLITAIMGALSHNYDFTKGILKFSRLVNKYISRTFCDTGSFITGIFLSFDEKQGSVSVCDMGHGYLFLLRQGQARQIDGSENMPLGLEENFVPRGFSFSLKPGDILLLITDGIVEQSNEKGEEYGAQRFLSIISRNISLGLKRVKNEILKDLKEFRGFNPQHDDFTFLILQYQPGGR